VRKLVGPCQPTVELTQEIFTVRRALRPQVIQTFGAELV
jgi:hypothetical protein